MGITKTDRFTEQQNKLAILAKALGHPARIAIIEYLLKVDTCICGDIVNELPLAQPTVSQHLKELREIGLIHGEIDGIKINYCLCSATIQQQLQRFEAFFSPIKESASSCEISTCK